MADSRVVFIAAFTVLIVGLGPVHADPKNPSARTRIAVMNLVAERGLDEGLIKLLNELLLTEFQKTGQYEVLGGSDIVSMLKHEERKMMAGCDDASCMAEIGGALGVDKLAVGNLGRVGKRYLLNLKILNVRKAKVENRVSHQFEAVEDKLPSAISRAVRQLVTGKTSTGTTGVAAGRDSSMHPYRLWGHVSLWSGVGCTALGLTSLFLAKSTGDDYNATGNMDDYDSSQMWEGIMWTGFSLGAALMATGLTLWLIEPRENTGPTASVGPAMDGRGLVFSMTGRW